VRGWREKERREGREEEGRGGKGGAGETRHCNPSFLSAPLEADTEAVSLCDPVRVTSVSRV